ncbi:hypothetical protein PSCLAVI8L_460022 [Pseudoclavibacter sp. 8L]|nr:hypothetical protein PSCLAVI8L_460022 [Pseudoclavibacter sp. 8L]
MPVGQLTSCRQARATPRDQSRVRAGVAAVRRLQRHDHPDDGLAVSHGAEALGHVLAGGFGGEGPPLLVRPLLWDRLDLTEPRFH